MWQTFFYDRTFYLLKYSNPHLFKLFADVQKKDMSLTCLLESYAIAVAGAGQSDKSEFTIGEAGSLCKMGLERRAQHRGQACKNHPIRHGQTNRES